jgi:tRNA (guanine-N7-)-methyltransferase
MRIRQHVNPLKSDFLTPRGLRIDPPPGREVEVEIGCAEAWFLFDRVSADRRRWAVGLEIRRELVDPVNERARDLGLPVHAVFCHANIDLPGMFRPASVARFFVNFPDPWFKKRHHKRRLLDEDMVAACATALRPGGELFFQSDVWELALEALAVCEQEPGLVNLGGAWSFWRDGNPYGARSRRETACAADGLPVWRIWYRRAAR